MQASLFREKDLRPRRGDKYHSMARGTVASPKRSHRYRLVGGALSSVSGSSNSLLARYLAVGEI